MSIKRTDLYLYKTSSSTNEKMKALSNWFTFVGRAKNMRDANGTLTPGNQTVWSFTCSAPCIVV
jgi:hypothetical protein